MFYTRSQIGNLSDESSILHGEVGFLIDLALKCEHDDGSVVYDRAISCMAS